MGEKQKQGLLTRRSPGSSPQELDCRPGSGCSVPRKKWVQVNSYPASRKFSAFETLSITVVTMFAWLSTRFVFE